jgi:hypothetical protein
VTDASGRGNVGTIFGATRVTGCRFGRCLSFDGIDDVLTIPPAPVLEPGLALTIEAWVLPTLRPGYQVIVDKTATGEASSYYLTLFDDELAFGAYTGGMWIEHVTNGLGLTGDVWRHVAAVFGDLENGVRLYVDGTVVLAEIEQTSLVPNGAPLRLGMGFPNEGYAGRLDEVRVYSRVLGVDEIRADMLRPVP